MRFGFALVTLGMVSRSAVLQAQTPTPPSRPFDPTRILTQSLHDPAFGRYETGPVQVEMLADGRKMRLLQEVRYIDPQGKLWKAPAGWIVDGASIPRSCWTLVGGPYEGKYREASILHDYACDKHLETSAAAARLFYNAMRCSRVPKAKAKAMFWAVANFGPQWGAKASSPVGGGMPAGGAAPPHELTASEIRVMLQKIEREDPSLEQLQTND